MSVTKAILAGVSLENNHSSPGVTSGLIFNVRASGIKSKSSFYTGLLWYGYGEDWYLFLPLAFSYNYAQSENVRPYFFFGAAPNIASLEGYYERYTSFGVNPILGTGLDFKIRENYIRTEVSTELGNINFMLGFVF